MADERDLAQSVQDLLGRLAERDRELMTANADLALHRGELDRARQLFRDLEEEFPDDLNALLGPLQVLFLRQDYNGILDAIGKSGPRSAPRGAGLRHARAGAPSLEHRSFKEGLTIDQDEVAVSMAHSTIEVDRLVEADAELSEVLIKNPNRSAHFARAVIAYEDERWADAINTTKAAERSAITIDKRIIVLMAYALYENGQKADAFIATRRIMRIDEDDPCAYSARRSSSKPVNTRMPWTFYAPTFAVSPIGRNSTRRALALAMSGDLPQPWRNRRRSSKSSNDPDILRQHALTLAKNGDLEAARAMIAHFPDGTDPRISLLSSALFDLDRDYRRLQPPCPHLDNPEAATMSPSRHPR